MDQECPFRELCQAWKLPEGQLAGPGECRWNCSGEHPCAAGETCAPTLHDGQLLDAVNVALACAPETPAQGCEGLECHQCAPEHMGRSFCVEDVVYGCFLALHPVCGLTCQALQFEDCGSFGCRETALGASCVEGVFGPDWCTEFDCADCGPSGEPGSLFCDGNEVVACTSLPMHDELCTGTCACEQICRRKVVASCDGKCVESGGAHCEP